MAIMTIYIALLGSLMNSAKDFATFSAAKSCHVTATALSRERFILTIRNWQTRLHTMRKIYSVVRHGQPRIDRI